MVGKTKISSRTPDQVEAAATREKRRRSPGRPKSPARTKSPGRKSPGRTSPARTKAEVVKSSADTPTRTSTRTRSPARLRNASPTTSTPILTPSRRSPIRRSPARAVKEVSEDKDIPVIRTRKQKIIIDTDTDSDNTESVPEVKEKPKATVRGRTRRIDVEIEPEDKAEGKSLDIDEVNTLGLVRRFTRNSQNREIERVVHLKHFDSVTVTKRLGEFSDEDEVILKKPQSELQEFTDTKNIIEFGGVYGALFLIFSLPLSVVALHMICNEHHCTFTKLPDLKKVLSLSHFFDVKSFLGVIAYATLLSILSALPFGGPKVAGLPNKHGKLNYVMNGFLSLVILLSIGCGLELKNIPIADYIIDHIFHLLIASIFCGAVISIYAYIRSFYVPVSALNAHVVGKPGIYSFFMGREVNPRIFSVVDLKLLFFRSFILGQILIDFAFLYSSLEQSISTKESGNYTLDPRLLNLQPTLLVYVLLHSIYFLDAIVFESSWITSFELQQEAFGYMVAMTYFVYPFLSTSVVKYIVDNGVELESWKLALSSVVFALGYILYRGSNNQKDAFRKNPYSPALSSLETIPTTQGKKLLVSGFWGIVRHPNYLGDILIHLSFVPFVVSAPPVIYPYLVILLLIHRSVRDNARCKVKYGAAWDRYCNRVKYVLIPKVY